MSFYPAFREGSDEKTSGCLVEVLRLNSANIAEKPGTDIGLPPGERERGDAWYMERQRDCLREH